MSSNFCSCGLKLSHFPSDSYQLCWNLHKHFDERFHPRCVIHVTFCKLIEVPNGEDEKVIWQFHRLGNKYWSLGWQWVYLQRTLARLICIYIINTPIELTLVWCINVEFIFMFSLFPSHLQPTKPLDSTPVQPAENQELKKGD